VRGWILEEIDSVEKRAASDGDNQINGIEVFSAEETSSEVGFWVNGSIKFAAERAKEAQE